MVCYFIPERATSVSHILYLPASNYFSGSKPQATVSSPGQPGDAPAVDARSLPPANLQLGWELGQRLDMHIYLTTSPNGDVFSNQWTSGWRENADKDLPNFVWENITFGNWKDSRTVEMQINFPPVSNFLIVRT